MTFKTVLTVTGPNLGNGDLKLAAALCEEIGAHLAVLAVALIVELTAVVLTLARTGPASSLWTDLARTSLFLLWIGFGCAAALCVLRPRLGRFSLPVASNLALGAMVAVVAPA